MPAGTRIEEHELEQRETEIPRPSASYRRRAWAEFQRAIDPLAPLKPPPQPHA